MEVQNKKVDASPTKGFFIYMLTRDIDVRPAIVELIDNSIDGAKKIRKDKEYKGLFIKINMSPDRFVIEDNCGGIDIETAQKYAFQFGRSSERESDSSGYFTGIFGIGMKRALFKLGKKFEVISKTTTEYFDLKVEVDEWINKPEWEFEFDKVEDVLKELRTVLGNIPLLLTFRTKKEGGEKAIDTKDYKELNLRAAKTGYVDFIDVEIFTGDDVVREIIDGAHAAGVRIIASNHDFFKTPAKSDIIYRLRKMQDMGADIPKIAVMPQSKRDVLTLLCATEEMVTDYADRPIITMSMAGTGVISRLCGEVFGSSMTFGAAKKASAPGQMGVNDLNTVLDLLHCAM